MGSRNAGNFRDLVGDSRSTAREIKKIQTAVVQNRPASIVVNTGISLLAMSHPAIATLVATYKASKAIYSLATTAKDAYDETGSATEAANAVVKKVVKSVEDIGRDEAIDTTIDVGWSAIKGLAGIKTDSIQDRILTTAAKSTLDEVLPK